MSYLYLAIEAILGDEAILDDDWRGSTAGILDEDGVEDVDGTGSRFGISFSLSESSTSSISGCLTAVVSYSNITILLNNESQNFKL